MNLDQIRHSFETLQHLQPPLLRKIPPLCRAIEEGQLDNTEYVKPVIKMLQQWAAAQTTLAEALPQPDAAQLTTLPALESWLRAHDGSTQLRQFLAVTGRMDNLTAPCTPIKRRRRPFWTAPRTTPISYLPWPSLWTSWSMASTSPTPP